jgi:hypothetical protein
MERKEDVVEVVIRFIFILIRKHLIYIFAMVSIHVYFILLNLPLFYFLPLLLFYEN